MAVEAVHSNSFHMEQAYTLDSLSWVNCLSNITVIFFVINIFYYSSKKTMNNFDMGRKTHSQQTTQNIVPDYQENNESGCSS